MSYDISIHVKAEGCEVYPVVCYPACSNPTYNLRNMFVACMDWDYEQYVEKENGGWQPRYYRCDFVIDKIEHGIRELRTNRAAYEKYNPENGWGDIDSAIRTLESIREAIYNEVQMIPINCLYMKW